MKLPKSKLFFSQKLIRLIKYETVLLMKKTGLKLNETSLVKFHETSEIISGIEKSWNFTSLGGATRAPEMFKNFDAELSIKGL